MRAATDYSQTIMTVLIRSFLALLMYSLSLSASAFNLLGSDEPDFLPPEQAFQVRADTPPGRIDLVFTVAPDYYVYDKAFQVQWAEGTTPAPELPKPRIIGVAERITDPTFGDVTIYRGEVTLSLSAPAHQAKGYADLVVSYQGCADAGLCYPPQRWQTVVDLANWQGETAATVAAPSLSSSPDGLAAWLASASWPTILAVFFALGLGLALTPCVLPMLPILSAIIAGQSQLTAARGFALALSYVLGMSVTYTAAGLLIAGLGASANVSAWLQQSMVLIVFALLFFGLAAVLWQGRDLRLPAFLHDRLVRWQQRQQGGQWLSVFAMGAISSLVVSPCVSAPLAGTLLFISTTQDMVLGGSALFMMSLGMGVPLLVLGAGGGRWIPKVGAWMDVIKRIFAWLLAAVAWSLLTRLLSPADAVIAWGGFLGLSALMLAAKPQPLRLVFAVLILLYAGLLTISGARGGTSLLTPWDMPSATMASTSLAFTKITEIADLEAAIATAAAAKQPVIVDLYADWCVSCIEMERDVLNQPVVVERMAAAARLKLDITNTTGAHLQWMEKHQLIGPPAYLFWSADGQLQASIVGTRSLNEFLSHLEQVWN